MAKWQAPKVSSVAGSIWLYGGSRKEGKRLYRHDIAKIWVWPRYATPA